MAILIRLFQLARNVPGCQLFAPMMSETLDASNKTQDDSIRFARHRPGIAPGMNRITLKLINTRFDSSSSTKLFRQCVVSALFNSRMRRSSF